MVLVVAACSAGEPGQAEHDERVGELERQVAEEPGWQVFELDNLNEGGGSTTWWLAPCDAARDETRNAILSSYQGSDIADEPGAYSVGEREVPCELPATQIDFGREARTLSADVAMLRVSNRWVLVPAADQIALTDSFDGQTHGLSRDNISTRGDCDGVSGWQAIWNHGDFDVWAEACLNTLRALPETVRILLPPGQDLAMADAVDIGGLEDAVAGALDHAGWVRIEGRGVTVWNGPCHLIDRTENRTVASISGSLLQTAARRCE